MTAFQAMCWKECRENIRWAILGLLALSLGLAYAWYHLFQQPDFPSFSNVWGSENLVLTITTPLIALALGLLQILPELRRDQWAFLVHRPASRSLLFFGKVLPGICLYLLATVLPLLGLAAWASSPSHVPAPFDFRFTLAGWAAILAGLPFYFAGLLVALRPARWYGSRALPILTALLAPWAAAQFYEFWQVALAVFAVIAILLPAAWGSFVSGGEYKEQTKPARFLLGLTLYPAVLAVGLVVLMLPFAAYNGLSHGENQEWWQTEQKIDTQGHIYQSEEHHDSQGHTTILVTDLKGQHIDPHVWRNLEQTGKLLNFNYLPLMPFQGTFVPRYTNSDRYILSLTSTMSDDQQTYWYYATALRQAVCYEVNHHICSAKGYLGPKGFASNIAPAGAFETERPGGDSFMGAGFNLLRFPHTLYWYNTESPAIGVIQTAPGLEGIAGISTVGGSDGRDNPHLALAVAAEGQITLYGHDETAPDIPRKLFTTPIAVPADPHDNGDDVQIARSPNGGRFFFWYPASRSQPNRIVTTAFDGRVLKAETFPAAKNRYTVHQPRFAEKASAIALPLTALSAVTLYVSIGHNLGWPSAEGFWLPGIGPILFFSMLGGLVPAVLAWRISLRLGDGRRGQIAWILGVFGLGIYGVLLLLALRAWPARVPCPNCRRLRVVDREECEQCGAAFARPRPDGTEIFDAREKIDAAGQKTI